MSVGWFGVPGKRTRGGLVHFVQFGVAVCKTRQAEGAEYQFCASGATPSNMQMVECRKCRRIMRIPNPMGQPPPRLGGGSVAPGCSHPNGSE